MRVSGGARLRTLADGLRTQSIGPINFEHIRQYVDDMVTVTEEEIRTAMRRIVSNARMVAEPSGAVTFAAWLFHAGELPESKKAVAVVSGGNVDPQLLAQVLLNRIQREASLSAGRASHDFLLQESVQVSHSS